MTQKKVDVIKCPNCGHFLDPKVYETTLPEIVDESKVIREIHTEYFPITVQCSTCAYYTVYTN